MTRNMIQVAPERFPWLDLRRYTFTLGVEGHGVVYASGQTASAYDPRAGEVRCKGDLLEQTRLAYEKIGVVLAAAGLDFRHVVQTVDYVNPVALPHYRQTADIRKEYLGDGPVASTGICVERLLRPDALIEVSAIAMREPKRALNPGWPEFDRLTFAPGVEAGGVVWLSGFIGYETLDGERSYPRETARQVNLAYGFIGDVLKAAGAEPGDVVKSLDYVDPKARLQYRDTGEVRRRFYGGRYPAATGVVINRLLRPEGHVEVEAVAVKGGTREEVRVPEWEPRFQNLTYAPAVKKGHMLHIAGQPAVDHATNRSVGGWDMAAQAEQAYANIARTVAEAGYAMSDVVNTIEWVAANGLMGYRAVADVRRRYFGSGFPSATGVVVHELLRPEWLIEVTAVAMV